MIYAFVTYTLLMLVYTAINIPYCALGAVLTADPKERVSVQSYRFVFCHARWFDGDCFNFAFSRVFWSGR